MKLRNKKTGEIRDFIINKDKIQTASAIDCWEYNSLAELNEEWEDYEEPVYYYFIQDDRRIGCDAVDPYNHKSKVEEHKFIGNYFETKEEAEKAVEKLKAWKRLRDKGFRFEGWDNTDRTTIHNFSLFVAIEDLESINKDLDLLFGGDE